MAYRSKKLAQVTTAGGTSGTLAGTESNLGEMVNLTLIIDLTAASGDAGDTLDIYIQGSIAGYWVDLTRITRTVAQGTKTWDKIILGSDASHSSQTRQNLAITADTVRLGPWGDAIRAWYVVTDADNDSAYTFGIAFFAEG